MLHVYKKIKRPKENDHFTLFSTFQIFLIYFVFCCLLTLFCDLRSKELIWEKRIWKLLIITSKKRHNIVLTSIISSHEIKILYSYCKHRSVISAWVSDVAFNYFFWWILGEWLHGFNKHVLVYGYLPMVEKAFLLSHFNSMLPVCGT